MVDVGRWFAVAASSAATAAGASVADGARRANATSSDAGRASDRTASGGYRNSLTDDGPGANDGQDERGP